ncbi:GatB/YqeY domain-containing protein [Singulisphaera acidiphila]|uniref:Yqey-like protein n=1 Tax=Singulisphaera acidiphila (strain ATCC BAA-1392 / DSM 18658 / VKM B-2454 / MOB10) TaxID=886293 RepID=L0DHV8_SINAD|nr:GatB/YqeY domain-containing protein [Singulisphaera acidiphila]AGA28847.1 Yqey-like protein [Singulisphaera acidiphila DSM 18658]
MTIVQRMRASLTESMKARDATRTQFLRYWIAGLTLGTGEEMPDADAIKKMRGVLKEAKGGTTTFTPEELALLQDWVPPAMTREQVGEALAPVAEQIRKAPKEGMAIGIAMKTLAGQPADSDDVRAVIAELRQDVEGQ